MPPLTPPTITRLDPAVPLLWRDADTLQLGLADGIRIPVDAEWVELLLARMAAGFRRSAFDVVAHAVGAPRGEARMLLARLQPLLVDDDRSVPPAAWVEGVDLADARCEYRMREALADEGVVIADRADRGAVGVVLVRGAAAALQFAGYLRDDTPHLPVALERGRTTIGPLVLPGTTPCLSCRDAHERDADGAWPRMHAQLIGRDPGPVSAARIADAATLVARVLTGPPEGGAFVEVSEGERVWRSATFHEECRCRETSSRSPRGNERAHALPAPRSATTTAREYALPA